MSLPVRELLIALVQSSARRNPFAWKESGVETDERTRVIRRLAEDLAYSFVKRFPEVFPQAKVDDDGNVYVRDVEPFIDRFVPTIEAGLKAGYLTIKPDGGFQYELHAVIQAPFYNGGIVETLQVLAHDVWGTGN